MHHPYRKEVLSHTQTYICTYACARAHMHTHARMYAQTHTHSRTHIHTHRHTHRLSGAVGEHRAQVFPGVHSFEYCSKIAQPVILLHDQVSLIWLTLV